MSYLLRVYLAVTKLYVFVFARPSMQRLNNLFLDLAIHGKGYGNFGSLRSTGERIFIERLARYRPSFCVDVGANKGEYSKALLEMTTARVIAFEPLPKAFESLKALETAHPDRIRAVNKGVGDRNQMLDLHYGAEDSEFASFSTEVNEIGYVGESNQNVMKIEVITLDRYFDETAGLPAAEIDLLKIDTEGFEFEVLSGARVTIERLKPKFIQIEYNWHQLFKGQSLYGIASLLKSYTAYQLLPYGEGWSKIDVKLPQSNIYQYSNFVFVRPDLSP